MRRLFLRRANQVKLAQAGNLALILLLLLTLGILAAPESVHACSCEAPPSPGQALDRADVVFAGTVLDVDSFALPLLDNPNLPVRVTFEVSEVWKGNLSERVVIRTGRDEAGCGFNFSIGTDYLVYAHQGEDEYATGLCDRTMASSNASADLAALGAGDPPITAGEGSPIWLRVALGGLFFLLGVGAVFAFAVLRGRPAARKEQL